MQANSQPRTVSHDFARGKFQIIHHELPRRVARDLQRDDRTGSEPTKFAQRHPLMTQADRCLDGELRDARQFPFERSARRSNFQFHGGGVQDRNPAATSAMRRRLCVPRNSIGARKDETCWKLTFPAVEADMTGQHLTTQAQRPRPRWSLIATEARWPGSLQRMVRVRCPSHPIFLFVNSPTRVRPVSQRTATATIHNNANSKSKTAKTLKLRK